MVCISKIVPFKSGLMAFGRVFSGTIETGQKVRVITAEGDKGQIKSITKLGICMGKDFVPVLRMPAGNTVVIGGLDTAILKEATVSDPNIESNTFKSMKFSVSPVVQVAVKVKRPMDIDKLVKVLRKLS